MNQPSSVQRSWWSAYGPMCSLIGILALALAILFLTAKGASQPEAPPAPPASANSIDPKSAYEAVQEIVRKTGGDFKKVSAKDREALDEAGRGNGKQAYERMVATLKRAGGLPAPKAK